MCRQTSGAAQSVQRTIHGAYRQQSNRRLLRGVACQQAGFDLALQFRDPRALGRALGKNKLIVEALQRERA